MVKDKRVNSFYVLLVILGVVFGLTTCTYCLMTVRMSTAAGVSASGESGLVPFMNKHGLTLMGVELALLAVATAAAIGTDSYWAGRDAGCSGEGERSDS